MKESKYSGVSASILSLAISIAGFSHLELTVWWHFALAALAILALYFIIFFIIEKIICLYDKYYKRASIKTDEADELQQLNNCIMEICSRHNLCEQAKIDSYKPIVTSEISALYGKAMKKIEFIERFRNSPMLKNRLKISDEKIKEYRDFCAYIKGQYKL